MIKFNYVEWSNFLSTGSTPVKMELNTSPTTLIRGKNGSGKTTSLDALCYTLFNKPLRDVKLTQLVNSVNKKKTLTKVNFCINGVEYEVHRGQKPSIFQIFVDGELMNEDASARDLQNKLETDILKCDYKTFTQVVIMASTGFSYFMELSAPERRKVVEAMLDIEVIGNMSVLMKERVKEVNHKLESIDNKIEICQNKYNSQETFVNSLSTVSEEQLKDLYESKSKYEQDLKELELLYTQESKNICVIPEPSYPDEPTLEVPVYPEEPEYLTVFEKPEEPEYLDYSLPEEPVKPEDPSTLLDEKNDIIYKQKSLLVLADNEKSVAKFYQDNDSCDRCNQRIDLEFKKNIILSTNNKLADAGAEYKNLQSKLDDVQSKLENINTRNEIYNQYKDECSRIINENKMMNAKIESEYKHALMVAENKMHSINDQTRFGYNNKKQSILNSVTVNNQQLMNDYNKEVYEIKHKYNELVNTENNRHKGVMDSINQKLSFVRDNLSNTNAQIQKLERSKTDNIQSHHDELKRLNTELTERLNERSVITEEYELCKLGTEMLKDSGLKAKIVEQYLPTINLYINDYLDKMGANYSFVLDDQFNETIKSRYRDTFSYGSFSNGERSRINFAIMLAWRLLAQSKNTISSNLLYIDEVLDGSLDDEGIFSVMNIFESMVGTNIFVISHREEIEDYFDANINVSKVGNYSMYEFNS